MCECADGKIITAHDSQFTTFQSIVALGSDECIGYPYLYKKIGIPRAKISALGAGGARINTGFFA